MRRLQSPYVGDSALALLLGAVTAVATIPASDGNGDGSLRWTTFALIALAALPLVWRQSRPTASTVAVCAATWMYLWFGHPIGPVFILPTVAVFSYAFNVSRRRAWWVLSILTVATYLALKISIDRAWTVSLSGELELAWAVAIYLLWTVFPVMTASIWWGAQRSREQVAAAERRGQRAQERVDLARDIHDVVGHSLAVVTMNAQVALHRLDKPGSDPRLHLEAIRDSSTAALQDLRQTVAFLREGDRADQVAVRTMEDLPTLFEQVEAAGLHVVSQIDPTEDVSAVVTTTVYRIVQESVTNVLRHSRATEVRVKVSCRDSQVNVDISDSGPARDARTSQSGRGIEGMRERVDAVGGKLKTTASSDGFTVNAVVPRQ